MGDIPIPVMWWVHWGFFPVYTGNIYPFDQYNHLQKVLPRIHGEHIIAVNLWAIMHGSSPYTRGTLSLRLTTPYIGRFIPVHTGNMTATQPNRSQNAVHPRTHGEHKSSTSSPAASFGSSPYTRGTLSLRLTTPYIGRFIPVHTGNMTATQPNRSQNAVHPRTHGEHKSSTSSPAASFGSSPYTRGTLFTPNLDYQVLRFIPVHTGNIAY